MSSVHETRAWSKLVDLQQSLHRTARERVLAEGDDPDDEQGPLWDVDQSQLFFAPRAGGIYVTYAGECDDELLAPVLECLAHEDVASLLVGLELRGPDEGANGTREWTITPLTQPSVRFPMLRRLFIAPTKPEDHNLSLVVRRDLIMEEGGDIARVVANAPNLAELTVPNAPDASFFDVELPNLWFLRIGSSWRTQGFIGNLARAKNLPGLRSLDFAESCQPHSEWADAREESLVTPVGDYEALFSSDVLANVHTFVLRNTCLTLETLRSLVERLRAERRDAFSFQIVQETRGGYVSHMQRNVFPWRHLLPGDPGLR